MKKIIYAKTGQEEEVTDMDSIKEVCEAKFGIPFGCKDGICGTCIVKVVEGYENLSEKNEKETDMLPEDNNERLVCQFDIKKGSVKIDTIY